MHTPMDNVSIQKSNPKIINLFGGAGVGKSTLAANTFYNLKCLGLNCELVTEYAKDLVWKSAHKVLTDEVYVFAKQHHRLKMVATSNVDYIVTDSPLLLPIIYDPDNDMVFKHFIKHIFNKYDNYNFILERKKKYNPVGRLQTEHEARELDNVIKKMLDDENIPYTMISDPEHGWVDVKRVLNL